MSEQEDPVSRRQFFRGMTGGFFRAIGELSGLDKLVEEQLPEMVNLSEDDILVPPEVQQANLSQIFAFLEQQSETAEAEAGVEAGVEAGAEVEAPVEPLATDPEAEAASPAPEAELEGG